MPLIANWPGVIPKGGISGALVGTNDLMATFAELADEKLGDQEGPDSISFANLLRNPKAEGARKNLIMKSVVSFVVREGDWKLCVSPGSGIPANMGNGVGAGNDPTPEVAWKAALEEVDGKVTEEDLLKAPFVQLYYVAKDPHEDDNLAANQPERVEKMIRMLKGQIENGRSTPGPKLKNDKNVIIVSAKDRRLPAFVRERLK